MNTLQNPGVHLHRATRTDVLARALGEVLATPLGDPFAQETVAVPTPGIERWLSQVLATRLGTSDGHADGVCAGIDFTNFDGLVRRLTEHAAGVERSSDPWRSGNGVWSLLRVLDGHLDAPWAGRLRPHFDPDTPTARRYSRAAEIFGLFQSYAAQRPTLLDRWRDGDLVDAHGDPLDAESGWQALLWQQLRAEIGGPDPAERLALVTALLTDGAGIDWLPPRLSAFGLTRLSAAQSHVLAALGQRHQVHLWLPHPSPMLWQRIAGVTSAVRGLRADDQTGQLAGHRLNRRLARDARELQLSLAGVADTDQCHDPASGDSAGSDSAGSDSGAAPTLLRRLQTAIADDLENPPRQPVTATDDSIRFHSCHGPDRQVEVLREVVLGLLSDHPELELRDILVMCPDIENFAPLLSAAFATDGTVEATHPGQNLQVRLADRSLRQVNPLLAILSSLLELGESRAGASTLLDLCSAPPVARRFHFSENDLDRLRQLIPESGIRWGLDQEHRGRFKMDSFGQNTWAAGLDRMLLGVAMSEDGHHWQGTTFPLDGVESGDVDLVGRLAELISRVRRVLLSFHGRHRVGVWLTACREALDLMTDVSLDDGWQRTHAWAEIAALGEGATLGEPDAEPVLSAADIKALLAEAFAGRARRANFRTGALTVCTMSPMRSVTHRVVILLGIDEGVFPRSGIPSGDDLLARAPQTGDRDHRSEDRQLLLDAVLAAGEQLVVIHCGASAQSGEPVPMAVPLREVRSAIDQLCPPDTVSDPGRDRVSVRQPLNAYSPRNFAGPTPFSFDRVARAAGEATLAPRNHRPPVFATDRLPPDPALQIAPGAADEKVQVDLDSLHTFFKHPARSLVRRRASLYLGEDDKPAPDELPLDLDGLQRWAIGDRALGQYLSGVSLDAIREAELRRGDLPPQQLGRSLFAEIAAEVEDIAQAVEPWRQTPAEATWISTDVGSRFQVTGLVSGIRDRTVLRVGYGRLSATHRLASWLDLLALTVAFPGTPWRAVAVGKKGVSTVLGPLREVDARARLHELLGLWARGATELVRLPPQTSAEQAEADRYNRNGYAVGNKWRFEHDLIWQRFGLDKTLDSLNSDPPIPGAGSSGRPGSPPRSEFQTLTAMVWGPLLEAEGKP